MSETLTVDKIIMEAMADGMAICDRGGYFINLNKPFLKIFGYKEKSVVLNKPWIMLYPEEEKERFISEINPILHLKGKWTGELEGIKRDGSKFFHEASLSVFKENSASFYIIVVRDTTNKRLFQDILIESEARYRQIAESAADIILTLTADGKVKTVNKAFEKITGRNKKKYIGNDFTCAYIHPDDSKRIKSCFSKLYKNKSRTVFEGRFCRHDGNYIWLNCGCCPVFDEKGNLKEVVIISRDVTEEKLKQEKNEKLVIKKSSELSKAKAELKQARRLSDLGALSAIVAHELRNPLATINSALYNIERKVKTGDSSIDKHIVNIKKKVAQSEKIIDNLLTYSNIKMPQYEKIRLNSFMDEIFSNAKEKARREKVKIQKMFQFPKNTVIDADPVQLQETIENLINNAVESMEDAGGNRKIDIRAWLNWNNILIISISDNGAGIDRKIIRKVTDPFFTTKSKGTGLGLAVCKQIAELHRGSIKIRSEKGKGTEVQIKIPSKRISAAEEK